MGCALTCHNIAIWEPNNRDPRVSRGGDGTEPIESFAANATLDPRIALEYVHFGVPIEVV